MVSRDRHADASLPVEARTYHACDVSRDDVSESARLVDPAIGWLRWIGVAVMLLIVLAWPYPGRNGASLWPLVVAFAAYNGVVVLLRRTVPRLHSWRWVAVLDLPVAATLFYLDYEPGGPMFLSFLLGIATAALSWPLPAAAFYAAVTAAVVAVLGPTLPGWLASQADMRQLAARVVVLSGVGTGIALLRQQLERAAETARDRYREVIRLEALERTRAEFLTSISHDLKTPLTAAQAGLGMLESSGAERLRSDERELLASARRSMQRLGFLIDDLLAFNLLNAGVLRLDVAPLDLREIVADGAVSVSPLLRQKEQTLAVDLPAALPVAGDPWRLEQVVVNLLANAHQHTPPGTRITVTGGVVNEEARLTVADTGPGVSAEMLEPVFEPFFRPRSTLGSGSGMGLAIARKLIELHGGRIWSEHAPGQGQGMVIQIVLPALEEAPRR